ncbi:MAG: glycosyltransferase [Acidimicrobiales bacterium]
MVTNLRYVGPIFEDGPVDSPQSGDSRVLVSFGTTNMRQGQVLQRVLDALEFLDSEVLCTLGGVSLGELHPPDNAKIRNWVPHMAVLSRTSAVITHAGLSTVMSALANGVPLVCMPMGRDQLWNADRVAALGVGCHISAESSVDAIRAAVTDVLEDSNFRHKARRMAEVIAEYGNGMKAASEVEALL